MIDYDDLARRLGAHIARRGPDCVNALGKEDWDFILACADAIRELRKERDVLARKLRIARLDAEENAKGASTERYWQDKQGDEYGSY